MYLGCYKYHLNILSHLLAFALSIQAYFGLHQTPSLIVNGDQ